MIRRKVHGYHEKIRDTWKAALPRRGSFEKFFKGDVLLKIEHVVNT